MKRIILPLDGYKSGEELKQALCVMITSPGMSELISHIKLNDGVHNSDMGGPEVVGMIRRYLEINECEIGIFLDLKIYDVSATVENVLKKYAACPPDILTVSSACCAQSFVKLRKLMPRTKLALVSMLTDIDRGECQERYGMSPEVKIYNDLMNLQRAYEKASSYAEMVSHPHLVDYLVCSPNELAFLKRNLPNHFGFIVPGIRDEWMNNSNEHQKRTTGVKLALDLAATYVVMGAQLTKGNPEKGIDPEISRR